MHQENLEFFYQQLTGKTVKDNGEIEINDLEKANCHTEVNMIDKDLTNIDLLNKYYPNTKSLLCCCVLSMSSNGSRNQSMTISAKSTRVKFKTF